MVWLVLPMVWHSSWLLYFSGLAIGFFGVFAQSIEQAASPLTAFMIGPIAQFIFIPFMTTGAGVDLLGTWFGVGADRGIALYIYSNRIDRVDGDIDSDAIAFVSKIISELSKVLVQITKWYFNIEPCSMPKITLDFNVSTMGLHNLLSDR